MSLFGDPKIDVVLSRYAAALAFGTDLCVATLAEIEDRCAAEGRDTRLASEERKHRKLVAQLDGWRALQERHADRLFGVADRQLNLSARRAATAARAFDLELEELLNE